MTIHDVTLKVKNYKCFQEETTLFEKIYPINVIVGKNNSGKSTILEAISASCTNELVAPENATFIFVETLRQNVIDAISKNTAEQTLQGVYYDHQNRLRQIEQHTKPIATRFGTTVFQVATDHCLQITDYEDTFDPVGVVPPPLHSKVKNQISNSLSKGTRYASRFFSPKRVFYLAAERDVTPAQKEKEFAIHPNGDGATNIFRKLVNESDQEENHIQETLRSGLNQIYKGECEFQSIVMQEIGDNWEIQFRETHKQGRIKLRESGSGLKTVILVLLYLQVIPKIKELKKDKAISDLIYCFEELENNLHPKLQRRLMKCIAEFVQEHGCHVFLTTHSSTIIEFFANDENAQILHVTHDGKTASVHQVESFGKHSAVLDDIGAKASDLLQANGIVWLEGPSDRIYFNKWIEIYSDGELKEHRDYECAFYGGSVLSHFGAEDPTTGEIQDFVNMLRVNRNAVIVGDSDKTDVGKQLKKRLQKIEQQVTDADSEGLHIWVTKAKEVENYIPLEALQKLYPNKNLKNDIGKHDWFHRTSKRKGGKEGYLQVYLNHESFDKVDFARKVVQHFTKDNLDERFDLPHQMESITRIIRQWNDDEALVLSSDNGAN